MGDDYPDPGPGRFWRIKPDGLVYEIQLRQKGRIGSRLVCRSEGVSEDTAADPAKLRGVMSRLLHTAWRRDIADSRIGDHGRRDS